MQHIQESDWGRMEDHCYFPEWADRPPARGSVHEVDHNSYLAGGYAEEFGHRAPGLAAEAVAMPAEGDGEWRVQIGGLHPGYPECPRPVDRDLPVAGGGGGAGDWLATHPAGGQRRNEAAGFRVVRVGGGGNARHRSWSPWRELWIRRQKLPLR